MKIVCLMDNVASSEEFESRFGLSFYIETGKHKILFDSGPDASFIDNAKKLGIDLTQVDMAILSHAHFDHAGGLDAFCEINKTAPIHIQRHALGKYYDLGPDDAYDLGLTDTLRNSGRLVLHEGVEELDAGLTLFSGITERLLFPPGNASLYMEDENGEKVPDTFLHEQSLLVTEGDHTVLIEGCAHNGIVNILNKAEEISATPIVAVFGGFHFKDTPNVPEFGAILAKRLTQTNAVYHTCHCTSVPGYEVMKGLMGDKIEYIAGGNVVEV